MITRKEIPVFVTSDGVEFTDEAKARAHQSRLDHEAGVDQYLAETGVKARVATTVKKHLLAFLASSHAPSATATAE